MRSGIKGRPFGQRRYRDRSLFRRGTRVYVLLGLLFLSACGALWGIPNSPITSSPTAPPGTPTLTPFQPETDIPSPTITLSPSPTVPTATPIPTDTLIPSFLWISPAVPDTLRQAALSSGLLLVDTPDAAATRLDLLNPQSTINDQQPSIWIYALVTPFPSTVDNVSFADLQAAWGGAAAGPFGGSPLWMTDSTLAAFTALWGAPGQRSVNVAASTQLLDAVWAARPAWAILPFEDLEPRWKVLTIDGQSPIHNDFDPAAYPLKAVFSLQPPVFGLLPSNRDPSKLTVLAMTGVTALTRGTADRMERYGVLYPGEEVRTALRSADITHVSNEVSFLGDCPTPDPYTGSMQFCSAPGYIALLEDVGVDVVELTGNHLLDYGTQPFLDTLDMYDQRGWYYFGGGRDLASAREPVTITHNGNKLAFLGCNYAGPPGDWATETRPGSLPCDLDGMASEVTRLRADGYLPVVTFQYHEYYQSNPTIIEEGVFRSMADAGAVIVSGSQSHEPAAMEFYGGAFVHYGLGNLFFDQMWSDETRQGFIDRHVFYAGRYIGTELLTYIIEDFARPRFMTAGERWELLQNIFSVSGW